MSKLEKLMIWVAVFILAALSYVLYLAVIEIALRLIGA